MRYIRFWLTGEYKTDNLTGLRGQYGDSGQDDTLLYDIDQINGRWVCQRWIHLETDPDAHAKVLVWESDDLFACLMAAELDAKAIVESMNEIEERD